MQAAQTYIDFIEINGVTYDFEGVPPAVGAPPPVQLAATAGDKQATITFSASDNTGATVLDYEYQLDSGPWTSIGGDTVAPFIVAGLTNGAELQLGDAHGERRLW